jgi:hypothetical protein
MLVVVPPAVALALKPIMELLEMDRQIGFSLQVAEPRSDQARDLHDARRRVRHEIDRRHE